MVATVTELVAGGMLILGLLTPLAAAASIGTMTVALLANHRKNGFFIFRPGEGYEYVLMIMFASAALAAIGPGRLSLDWALGIVHTGWGPLLLAAGLGWGAALAVLAVDWRAPVKE
jgi:putative oxidoreductase